MFKQSKILLFVLALMLFLAACSSSNSSSTDGSSTNEPSGNDQSSQEEEGEPKYGGVVNIATIAAPQLDPHRTSSIYTHAILGLVYSKLVTYETGPDVEYTDYNVVPDLAHDWSMSEDGLVYTFYLRDDAVWHDLPPVNGRNVTADDVIATFERIQTLPGHQAYLLEPVAEMEAVDELTVEFTLHEPFAPFLAYMANHFMWILPEEAVNGEISLEDHAIGTGPFMIEHHDQNVETIFAKHENYFIDGLPYLDGVHYRYIPDADTRLAAFRTGQADTTGIISPEQLDNLLRADPDLPYNENYFATQVQLFLNMTREPFDDLKVRQAISMAIDKQTAVDRIFGGGEISGPVNPSMGDWALPLEEREGLQPHDIEQAKQLLAEAGYPDGFNASLITTDAYGEGVVRMAQWIAEDLREIGINIELEMLDYATFYTQRYPNKEYDMGVSFQSYLQEPDEWLHSQLHTEGSKNWFGINDPALDEMIMEQRALLDPSERLDKVHEIQRYALQEVVNPIPLFTHIVKAPIQPYLKGWHTHASYGNIHMKHVWLDK